MLDPVDVGAVVDDGDLLVARLPRDQPRSVIETAVLLWISVSNSVLGFGQNSRFYGFVSPKPTRLALKPTFLKPTVLAVENRI